MLAALLVPRATCASPLSTARGLHTFLTGKWQLDKTFSYVRGGAPGTFSGTASFNALACADDILRLQYYEEGTAVLKGDRPMVLPATRRLLWEFAPNGNDYLVSVYFDESCSGAGNVAVVQSARFFHSIQLSPDGATPPPFDHPCGPDVYRGRLSLRMSDEFVLRWDVIGPRKTGTQLLCYKRVGDHTG